MLRCLMLHHCCSIAFLLALSMGGTLAAAADVDFVVGDYLQNEGGEWLPEQGPLVNPFGIDFDSEGNLYVVELVGGRVHRVDETGRVAQIAGDGSQSYLGDGGPAEQATFNGMHNCAITTEDQLLIADSWNHCVRRIDLKTGRIDTVVGTGEAGFAGDGGPARGATFDYVMCISLSPDQSRLHITDLKNRRIRDVSLSTWVVKTVAGNGEAGVPQDGTLATESPLVDPRAAASDRSGNLYVLERNGHALRVVDSSGRIRTVAGTGRKGYRDGPAFEAEFGAPKHLCLDERNRVYIADDLNGAIRRYDPATSQVVTVLGRGTGDPRVRLLHPHGVCVHNDMLYVIDSGNHRILRIPLPE